MPTKIFFDLNEQKQNKIIDVSITEFSTYGYENSSTNRIVQNAGISKGSLFKYFSNKEELYLFILDSVIQELITDLENSVNVLPQDLFDRIIKYSELEFNWYIRYPEKCRLITTAFSQNNGTIHQKIELKYYQKGQDIYYKVLEDIDTLALKWNKQKTVDILKWVLAGFKEDFISSIQNRNISDIDYLQQEYVRKLMEYIEILKSALIIEKSEG